MTHETQKAVLQAICLQDRFFVLFLKISGRNCLPSLLMRMQGKTPKGLRARQQCAHSASRTARPVADQTWPPFSRKAGKPRHPLWLSRRFDDATAQKGLLPGVVFLRNPGQPSAAFLFPKNSMPAPFRHRPHSMKSGVPRANADLSVGQPTDF